MDGSNFYTSSQWRKIRERKIVESGGVCSRCHHVFVDTSKLIVHHKDYLKEGDFNNPEKLYSDDNLEVICLSCHNEEHDRFNNRKSVYIVFGPPLSGKSTFVKENKERDDIIVDMDRLYSAVTMNEMYDKPDSLRFNLFAIVEDLIDQIKRRYGKWKNAWIVGGYANLYTREDLAKRLGATCILMDVSKEECLKRLDNVCDYRRDHKDKWASYIEKWFTEYSPHKF